MNSIMDDHGRAPRRHPLRALPEAAPAIALALMLVAPGVLGGGDADAAALRARESQLREAFAAAPFRVGAWVGTDVEVPRAAVEILQPTAILSRRFRHLTSGLDATLLIVHCADARDMQGHYPPVCYPANGWILPRDGAAACPLGGDAEATRYDFERLDDVGARRRLRVFNYFVLPDGTSGPDMASVNRLARRRSLSALGVAQVQVAFDGDLDEPTCRAAAEELLAGVAPLLASLGDPGEAHQGDE